jgi:hypothetical protein
MDGFRRLEQRPELGKGRLRFATARVLRLEQRPELGKGRWGFAMAGFLRLEQRRELGSFATPGFRLLKERGELGKGLGPRESGGFIAASSITMLLGSSGHFFRFSLWMG